MVAERREAEDADTLVLARCAMVRDRLSERIVHRFRRVEAPARRMRRYVAGLLERGDQKNGWQVADAIGEVGLPRVQRLLNGAMWGAETFREDLSWYMLEDVGNVLSGVLIIDEAGSPKKDACWCGVAPQPVSLMVGDKVRDSDDIKRTLVMQPCAVDLFQSGRRAAIAISCRTYRTRGGTGAQV